MYVKRKGWARARGALALLLAAAVMLAGSARPGEARGGAATANPNEVLGARLFDQCIAWVAQGSAGIQETSDFYIHVIAELELDAKRHRGPMRIWWKTPDKYRQELTSGGRTTTKILDGNSMWVIHPDRRVQRMHGTAAGARAIPQLAEDRDRMADLAQFITLGSLKGPSVTFTFDGEKTGSGSFEGKWLKVTRTAPGATRLHFWLAYDRDAQGRLMAKWPGIIRVDGDPRQGVPTEDFLLKDWVNSQADQPRRYRYPRRIEAFSRMPGRQAARFLSATVQDIKVNVGVPDSRFLPPQGR